MQHLRLPGLVLLAALLAFIGALLLNTAFMVYDDEGYVLLSLSNFSAQGGLYDQVFTQYGPAPYVYYDVIHWITGWPIAHSLGRAVTLFHWVAAALLTGLMVWRLSHRYWAGWFATAATFGYLWQMTSEPAHPGSLIAFITALGLAGAVEAILRRQPSLAGVSLGLAGAALLLTKINVGLLWCGTAGAFLLIMTGESHRRKRGTWLALAGMVLMPFVLMRPLLGESWVLTLAIMFSGSAVCVVSLLTAERGAVFRARDWIAGSSAFAALGLGLVGITILKGTSLAGLVDGVLFQPLRHPVHFQLSFVWSPLSWGLLAAALSLCGLWQWRPALRHGLTDLVAVLRLIGFVVYLCCLGNWLTIKGVGWLITVVLPLTPLFLLPLTSGPEGIDRRRALGLVALMGMGQVLHAYPVAGSQMGWGTFLLLALYIVGLVEAVAHLAQRLHLARWSAAVAVIALAACSLQLSWLLSTGWARWHTSLPLGLPAAETVRPPENIRYALRILTTNAQLHADLLYSQPGMFSFNLWSGIPTPTLRNATHWFWLLRPAEQRSIIERLEVTPRSVIITCPGLDTFLTDVLHVPITGPLVDHVRTHYRPLFSVSGYDFLVPKASQAEPFLVAENFSRRQETGAGEANMIKVNVVAQAVVDRVVVRHVNNIAHDFRVLNADNCRVVAEPINSSGQALGAAAPMGWPLRLEGLYRLKLYHRTGDFPARPGYQLLFLDAAGQSQFEACYNEPATVSAPPTGG